ncbi:lipocalin-like domain-containing protein [Pseudooctadecabacter jejudonensis]|uniref:Hydroxyneurosporene synthase (CrtC) n=1 Tax=Pseudooctadecabacter jejudonensis TaxID=1391910 RepID=A0A1Y5S2L2_9RHOB|nr:lipocalin-like domain-containing protein [Pseudooctadecabacter jejudonensis]SLN31236.1 Hydroxyneurosporene synthase (CrtC) [Pseudooctadecabacter jejudonensis]
MNVKSVLLAVLIPFAAYAQGFAGLGTATQDFATPQRPAEFDFPADHGPHPDYRIEWWYLTANLKDEDGTDYGLQWTLFRTALAAGEVDGWTSPQLWMGHAAVTTPDAHYVTERLARGGIGQAGVQADPFEAWIDDWQLAGPDFDNLRMTATAPDFAYDMQLTAQGPLVFHGDAGYSVKSAQGQASYYYSQPFYGIEGMLSLPGGDIPVTGQAWLDREWSSQPLSEDQTGWDWFSLSLGEGKLMGFRLRQTGGSHYTAATWIAPDGTTTPYPDGAFQADPLTVTDVGGRDVPTGWAVRLPDRGVEVEVQAINPQSWMSTSIPYWEGPVTISGSHQGRGYLEMTGYD